MVVIISLENFLKNDPDARKVFGKKEIGIILKQLRGIALTQSEKNRLSRDIRPKLRVASSLAEFENELELKKGAGITELIKKAVRLILEDKMKDRIIAVLLFGSHVSGLVTPRSDIDICVIFKGISAEEAVKFRIRILREFSEKVDVQVFNVLPQKIKRSIARSHRVLYKGKNFDNMSFTIRYLKDEDYFIRMKNIIGEAA